MGRRSAAMWVADVSGVCHGVSRVRSMCQKHTVTKQTKRHTKTFLKVT